MIYQRPQQVNEVFGFGMFVMAMSLMVGMVKSLMPAAAGLPLLPQTISPDGKEPTLSLTREQVTETILSNLVRAGVLLPEETRRYRKTLENYDNTTLLKVLLHSHELRELREG